MLSCSSNVPVALSIMVTSKHDSNSEKGFLELPKSLQICVVRRYISFKLDVLEVGLSQKTLVEQFQTHHGIS